MNDDLLDAILIESQIIMALPRTKKKAKSIRELGIILNIPQISMYRRFKPLQEWCNIGIVEKSRSNKLGTPEQFYYRKHDFEIHFKQGKTVIIYQY